MKKKMLVLSTTLLVLASGSLLAACGKNEDKKETAGSSSKPAATTAATPEKRGKISTTIYDRGNMVPEEGTLDKNRWTEWINKNGPVDVTFVPIPRTRPEDKLNVMFASGEIPDIIQDFSAANRSSWYESKLLMPLDDLIEKNSVELKALLKESPTLKKYATRPDGKIYDIPVQGKLDVNWVFLVRNDWLKKLGLEVPKTSDELFAVAKAMTEKDPDGNGKNDTFGMSLGGAYQNRIIDHMFGVPIWTNYLLKDGNLAFSWENQKASLDFKKRLFQENLIDKDFAADQTGDKARRDFLNGKLGFITGGMLTQAEMETLMKNDPNASLTPIAIPKSQFGQFSPPLTMPISNTAVISAKAKDPVAAIKYIDFMLKESTYKAMKWGIEGEHYKLTPAGCAAPIDADKNKKERGYAGDYGMMQSIPPAILKSCDDRIDNLLDSNPAQKEIKRLTIEARKVYLTPDRPVPDSVLELPGLSKDLDLIQQSVPSILMAAAKIGTPDEFVKAIVTSSYTAEQAVKNAQDTWAKAGGGKIDEFYATWYKNNKDKVIKNTDIYPTTK